MGWLILDSVNAQKYYQNEAAVRDLVASEIEYSEGSVSHRIIDIEIVTYDNRLSQLSRRFILDRLELLKSTDLVSARIDDLKAMLFDLLRAYTSTTLLIDENRPIFRARRHREDKNEKLLDHVNEVYPRACFIKRLGRANREGTPIFYFSADKVIALHELKPNIGEIFSVICAGRARESALFWCRSAFTNWLEDITQGLVESFRTPPSE